jgi:hypothetical protein
MGPVNRYGQPNRRAVNTLSGKGLAQGVRRPYNSLSSPQISVGNAIRHTV